MTEVEELRKVLRLKDEVILALEALLSAYRLGNQRRADIALERLERARAALPRLVQEKS